MWGWVGWGIGWPSALAVAGGGGGEGEAAAQQRHSGVLHRCPYLATSARSTPAVRKGRLAVTSLWPFGEQGRVGDGRAGRDPQRRRHAWAGRGQAVLSGRQPRGPSRAGWEVSWGPGAVSGEYPGQGSYRGQDCVSQPCADTALEGGAAASGASRMRPHLGQPYQWSPPDLTGTIFTCRVCSARGVINHALHEHGAAASVITNHLPPLPLLPPPLPLVAAELSRHPHDGHRLPQLLVVVHPLPGGARAIGRAGRGQVGGARHLARGHARSMSPPPAQRASCAPPPHPSLRSAS